MCDTCGCSPCVTCGGEIKDGVCVGCELAPSECSCEPAGEEQVEGPQEEELD